jgi:predicted  nucleic acid-binding Zn-ribbon protein
VTLLTPLLELQAFDLQSDRLGAERAALPEREALRVAGVAADTLEGSHALLVEKRRALADAEHGLGADVAAVAARAKAVEQTLYSGSVRIPKELTALQTEIRLFRVQQSEIEGRELGILEEIERAEAEIAENRARRAEIATEMKTLASALAAAEGAIDAERAKLDGQRAGLLEAIPSEVRVAYERLRGRERLGGRAAAAIVAGGCEGCHMKLPVLEYNRMKSKPEDALLLCIHCGRILVR